MVESSYRVVAYNVFIERGNVAVVSHYLCIYTQLIYIYTCYIQMSCSLPQRVQQWVSVLGWWRVDSSGAREEIHSGGRYLVTSQGRYLVLLIIYLSTQLMMSCCRYRRW